MADKKILSPAGEKLQAARRRLKDLTMDEGLRREMREAVTGADDLWASFNRAYALYEKGDSIRPTLGNEMQIFYMRERQTVMFLLFPELRKIAYEVARSLGYGVMAGQMAGKTLPEIMANNAPIALRDRYAIEEIVEADDRHAVYRHRECADCFGLPDLGMKICVYEAGTAAGCFSAQLGKNCRVTETRCCANGDPYCEFLVEVTDDPIDWEKE